MKKLTMLVAGVMLLAFVGCSSSSSSSKKKDDDDNGNGADPIVTGEVLSGVLYAPNGSTPIPNATVYIPSSGSTSSLAARQAATCPEPTEAWVAWTCTDEEGSYELTVPADYAQTGEEVTIKATKDAWSVQTTLVIGQSADMVFSATVAEGAANIAVIQGAYDSIENVLAKLGLGEVNDVGQLVTGTQTFDLYASNAASELFEEVTPGVYKIDEYDIVYVNCGASSAGVNNEVLRDYVAQGGRLYATDLASPFVIQPFEEYVERIASGPGGAQPESEVVYAPLAKWLASVTCTDGACIAPDHGIFLTGFAGGWHLLNPVDSAQGATVTTLVQGDLEGIITLDEPIQPLTMRFFHGDGVVVYSSYHTVSGTTGTEYLPQERVLEYLFYNAKD
ncbi:hypothetical protein [Desulfurivibrio alkaliphilus]|uniref:Lipoprotein n=1 Tax=Desulfurivibrio alkaliphilus (strain DSM 19089 / UNIQEM U267 / AHT2) TaxID=589865 RepID=D6Z0S1_DESAT|nr:hypothetical protein [Desulfurivibrio alkaliphilus]ADH85300.1 hypothetical protein DaAHT2_0594 [Desulfurivibrio alkaliphilus AHT 2]